DSSNQHHGKHDRCGQWRHQAKRQEETTAGFGQPRHQRMASTRHEAELFEEPSGPVESRTAEPSEQLLCPMCRQRQSHRQSQKKEPDVHAPTQSFCAVTTLSIYEPSYMYYTQLDFLC